MSIRFFFFFTVITLLSSHSFCQVKIGDSTGVVEPTAVLELKDTARGFLLPRMTQTQMNNIVTPPDGLLIYNNTSSSIYQYKQGIGEWRPIVADSS